MENKFEALQILNQIDEFNETLNSLIYGSIEKREINGRSYLYVHYKKEGKSFTKYVGEYDQDSLNLILSNNIKAKEINKQIRRLKRELDKLNYKETELNENVKLNIDFARRELVNTIYKQALLEGVVTTYADTQTIIGGGKVNNMTASDIMKVVNLKRAWDFILDKNIITSETDYYLLCEINKYILDGFYYNAGIVRSTPVQISGTNYRPPLPFEDKVKEDINSITSSNESVLDKAIDLLLYVMKCQIFIDGNKRCGVIFANHMLIKNGEGLIVIPDDQIEDYQKLLIDYYEDKGEDTIRTFLKEKCFICLKNPSN